LRNDIIIRNKRIQSSREILENEEYEGKILIVFKAESGEFDNLFCFEKTGKMLWRIQPASTNIAGTDKFPYIGISRKQQKICAVDFYGRRFEFDIDTGKIIGMDTVK